MIPNRFCLLSLSLLLFTHFSCIGFKFNYYFYFNFYVLTLKAAWTLKLYKKPRYFPDTKICWIQSDNYNFIISPWLKPKCLGIGSWDFVSSCALCPRHWDSASFSVQRAWAYNVHIKHFHGWILNVNIFMWLNIKFNFSIIQCPFIEIYIVLPEHFSFIIVKKTFQIQLSLVLCGKQTIFIFLLMVQRLWW